MSEEWSDWIEHDGSGCPVPAGTVVEGISVDWSGFEYAGCGVANGGASWTWRVICGLPRCSCPGVRAIIRYRLRRPPAVRLLVDIAEGLPIRELEDA